MTVYPIGTTTRFLALCEVERKVKNLEFAGFELWWRGYDVDPVLVRAVLYRAAERWDGAVATLRRLGTNRRGQAQLDQVVDESATRRMSEPVLRQVRKRVGRSSFSTLFRVVVEVASGRFNDYAQDSVSGSRDEEQALVERGLGLEGARTGRSPGGRPWLEGPSATSLAELSSIVRDHPLLGELEASSIADLEGARVELKSMIDLFIDVGRAFRQVFGVRAFGFGVLSAVLERFRPEDRAQFVLLWLMLRRHATQAFQEGYAALAVAAEDWGAEGQRAARALEALRLELPEVAEALAPRRMLAAQRDPRRLAALQVEIAKVRERHAVELDRFFARHPEYVID